VHNKYTHTYTHKHTPTHTHARIQLETAILRAEAAEGKVAESHSAIENATHELGAANENLARMEELRELAENKAHAAALQVCVYVMCLCLMSVSVSVSVSVPVCLCLCLCLCAV